MDQRNQAYPRAIQLRHLLTIRLGNKWQRKTVMTTMQTIIPGLGKSIASLFSRVAHFPYAPNGEASSSVAQDSAVSE